MVCRRKQTGPGSYEPGPGLTLSFMFPIIDRKCRCRKGSCPWGSSSCRAGTSSTSTGRRSRNRGCSRRSRSSGSSDQRWLRLWELVTTAAVEPSGPRIAAAVEPSGPRIAAAGKPSGPGVATSAILTPHPDRRDRLHHPRRRGRREPGRAAKHRLRTRAAIRARVIFLTRFGLLGLDDRGRNFLTRLANCV